ncbi:MAG: electron transfer flavoprotein subunit alpha [Candidatus Thermofonsia Clade 1 bacterium]|jgi:electron transfer flavoprotein alpha subunit|uniref:Electron transfer flavoprotein subunit alpha n=1 Tax=Candidatus Thermofonsia Clade 1 bacterium TaxID=2364210 RepID=A0A2M8PXM9_9CHLR|nr:MAG: electron transfer flavoprotein subunit alpha [Candidatus Thermofonsia Clade 1 bacterium]PJF42304.1 MAG: electron transfer flavoprotein subunit alpha [Candidatus Thermofonsia Clade 1 bacterium]RMF52284.1 MAG: electron transfer flavoprotein subunit alpha/FixB family protein [Chloroflexota bacterium]
MSGIFVWIDHFRGKALPASWESISAAQGLGGEITALVFGSGVGNLATLALHYGAHKVILCEDATLADYRLEPYAALLTKLVNDHAPRVVLSGATTRGRELLAAAAAETDSSLLPDVTELSLEGESIKAVHPAYAGKVLSDLVATSRTVFVTLRSRAFPLPQPDASRSGEVITVAPVMPAEQIATQIESFEEQRGSVNLTDAAIIVTGGRAVGSAEGFAPVRELAEVLGGAVGATRAAVDAGYIPYAHQVGQTGKVVSPNLYIAAGVSGSIQHQAGMRTSKIIVAINKDPDAPIFKIAHYGIIGDLFKVLPALSAAARAKLGK